MSRMKVWALSLVIAMVAATEAAGQRTGGRSGGFGGNLIFVPQPAPPPAPRPGTTSMRPGPLTPPAMPPPFSIRPFRAYRWAWPLMFYGGIGLGYFGDEFYGVASGTGPAFAPGEAPEGGLQLAVEPRRAAVYVDGMQVGTVDDFDGYYHHLSLTSGPHRIVILLDGYEPLSIDTVITPGRTSTYRGSLMRAPGR
jgi:hypothetical protein